MKLKAAVLFQHCIFLETKTLIDAVFFNWLHWSYCATHPEMHKMYYNVFNIISKSLPTMKLITWKSKTVYVDIFLLKWSVNK